MSTAEQTRLIWGIFGGSFNPPHIGHVLAAHFALSAWDLHKVLIVPSFQHPFGKPLVEYAHRIAMCGIAFKHLGPFVEISRAEEKLGGVSYTVDTLRVLHEQHPDVDFRLIIGSDILAEVEKWRAFEDVKKLAPLLVIPRLQNGKRADSNEILVSSQTGTCSQRGTESCYLPDVSSTSLREQLASGTDTGTALPAGVRDYIDVNYLYRS